MTDRMPFLDLMVLLYVISHDGILGKFISYHANPNVESIEALLFTHME
jgi:hypothetical protein